MRFAPVRRSRTPNLLHAARNGEASFFVQFGGQGAYYLSEMERLASANNCLGSLIDVCTDAIRDTFDRPDIREERAFIYEHGFHLRDWLRGRNVPPEDYMLKCQISFVSILVLQLAYLRVLEDQGFGPEDWKRFARGVTGHSQGIVAAVVFAMARSGYDFLQAAYDFVSWLAFSGFYVARHYSPPPVSERLREFSQLTDFAQPVPMAAISGMTAEELLGLLHDFNQDTSAPLLKLSLQNHATSHVLTGHPRDVAAFRERYLGLFLARGFEWAPIPVSAPFHHQEIMDVICDGITQDRATTRLPYTGADLQLPVISFVDGSNLQMQGQLSSALTDMLLNRPLEWPRALGPLKDDPAITHVIDFGPGRISSSLTRKVIGEKAAILNASTRSGLSGILASSAGALR